MSSGHRRVELEHVLLAVDADGLRRALHLDVGQAPVLAERRGDRLPRRRPTPRRRAPSRDPSGCRAPRCRGPSTSGSPARGGSSRRMRRRGAWGPRRSARPASRAGHARPAPKSPRCRAPAWRPRRARLRALLSRSLCTAWSRAHALKTKLTRMTGREPGQHRDPLAHPGEAALECQRAPPEVHARPPPREGERERERLGVARSSRAAPGPTVVASSCGSGSVWTGISSDAERKPSAPETNAPPPQR